MVRRSLTEVPASSSIPSTMSLTRSHSGNPIGYEIITAPLTTSSASSSAFLVRHTFLATWFWTRVHSQIVSTTLQPAAGNWKPHSTAAMPVCEIARKALRSRRQACIYINSSSAVATSWLKMELSLRTLEAISAASSSALKSTFWASGEHAAANKQDKALALAEIMQNPVQNMVLLVSGGYITVGVPLTIASPPPCGIHIIELFFNYRLHSHKLWVCIYTLLVRPLRNPIFCQLLAFQFQPV